VGKQRENGRVVGVQLTRSRLALAKSHPPSSGLTFLSIVVVMVEVEVMAQAGVRDGVVEAVWPVACRGALK
jgi:hypothetical protein